MAVAEFIDPAVLSGGAVALPTAIQGRNRRVISVEDITEGELDLIRAAEASAEGAHLGCGESSCWADPVEGWFPTRF